MSFLQTGERGFFFFFFFFLGGGAERERGEREGERGRRDRKREKQAQTDRCLTVRHTETERRVHGVKSQQIQTCKTSGFLGLLDPDYILDTSQYT